MTYYRNLHSDSPIRSVEIVPCDSGSYCVLHVTKDADRQEVKDWLSASGCGEKILAETPFNGHQLIVATSAKKPEDMLQQFSQRGDTLELPIIQKKFNPWKWRGITSLIGQSLQLVSSLTTAKSGADRAAIAGFATSNLLANVTNITFGSQKKEDFHQLANLKKEFNERFDHYLPSGEQMFSHEDDRCALRPEEEDTRNVRQKTHAVMKKYSVSGGEIGLRLFGASSLSFPITKWAKGLRTLQEGGSAKDVHDAVKNDSNPVTYKVGLVTLLGKFISLASKEPDPYNPDPPSLVDKLRENVTFKLSSVVEAAGAAWMAHDRFTKQKFNLGGKSYPDYFGGIGNLVFIGGYAIRFFAPYGSLEVDTKELNAHISDNMVKMPVDKLPQIAAEVAVDLKEHFKEKAPEVGEIYRQLAEELKKHHHIDLRAISDAQRETQWAATPQQAPASEKTFASSELKRIASTETMQPAESYRDKVSLPAQQAVGIAT